MDPAHENAEVVPGIEEFDPAEVLRRVGTVGYVVGVCSLVLATLLPGIHRSSHEPMLILAAVEACFGAALVGARRLPAWAVFALVIDAAVVFTSAAVAVVRPLGATTLFYVWPALTVGYFGERRYVGRTMALFVGAFALALAVGQSREVALMYYPPTLGVFLVVIVVTARIRARADELRAQLRRAAATDDLTGLLNRRAFRVAFEREVQRARQAGLPLSVVIFDLDHFKLVNDALGHAAGDEALRRFADVLRAACGPADLAARMGGEEFTVVLFDRDEAAARRIADEIGRRLREETGRDARPLTTSAGVATLGRGAGSPDALLQAADRALYAAKRAGRDAVVCAGDPGVRPLAIVADAA